jgi:hypothetical protein
MRKILIAIILLSSVAFSQTNNVRANHDTLSSYKTDSIVVLKKTHFNVAIQQIYVNHLVDSLAAYRLLLDNHSDSINVYRVLLNALKDTASIHRGLLNAHADSIGTHRTILDALIDTTGKHRSDINILYGTKQNTIPNLSDTSLYARKAEVLTINGTSQDLSTNRTWSVGTIVASDTTLLHNQIALRLLPSDTTNIHDQIMLRQIIGTYLIPSDTTTFRTASNGFYQLKGTYVTTETDPTIYSWAKASTKPTYTYSEVGADAAGAAAAITLSGLGGQPQLNGTGFVKASGTTISYDNSTYLTGNQTITLGGILSGSGTTSITTSAATGYYMPSTTDQSNWNGKQTAYTILSTLGGLSNTSGVLTNNGTGTLSWSTAGTVTSITAGTFLTGGTITSSGTIAADTAQYATSSKSGFLKYSDWVTFNSKGSGSGSVTSVSSGNGLSGGTITTTGTISLDTTFKATASQTGLLSYADYIAFSAKGTIGGSGTTGYIPVFSGTSAIGNSGLYWDGTNLGIGTTNPGATLDVVGYSNMGQSLSLGKGVSSTWVGLGFNRNVQTGAIFDSSRYAFQLTRTTGDVLQFEVYNSSGTLITASALAINSTGSVSIGTTDPQGYKLYNNGTLYNNGAGTFAGKLASTTSLEIQQYNGTGTGLSLYGTDSYVNGFPNYGISFATTATGGTYGAVNADYATYFTTNNTAGRGWIFKEAWNNVNVASISNAGIATFAGSVTATGYTASAMTSAGVVINNSSGVLSSTATLADSYISSASTWNFTTSRFNADSATWNAKQTAYTILSTLGALSNSAGWLHNDGSGTLAYSTPMVYPGAGIPVSSGSAWSTSISCVNQIGTYQSLYIAGGNLSATGSYNIGLGVSALSANTDGIRNTGLGFNALSANTSGYYNTADGSYALSANTTGFYNVGLGANAGQHIADDATNNQTSYRSVYLGVNTKANADGDYNEIVIGYNAIGAGSNTATLGNSSITSTVLRGAVTATSFNGSWVGSTIGTSYTAAKCTATWPNTYSANQNLNTTDAPTFASVTMGSATIAWDGDNNDVWINSAVQISGTLNTTTSVRSTYFYPEATQTSLTATTGHCYCMQPFRGGSYKKVLVYLDAYYTASVGSQTYTFPTAFAYTPVTTSNATNVTYSVTTTYINLACPSSSGTGWIMIEGY